ncbi:hypothetical protein C0993_005442 [Termitomyces sp. T159_Od127]|nr:hypothetical protein C0993_005442 [Termitomyces sp. T159_Od127]
MTRSVTFPLTPSAMKYITRDVNTVPSSCTLDEAHKFQELADKMKTSVRMKDFVVVDVRDDDYEGGNIKGAINKPSRDFLTSVDELVKDTKHIPFVIFHCALSQVRLSRDLLYQNSGPKAARIYEETRGNVLYGKDIPHEVVVLRDGFTRFQEKYKDDPDLVENWDKEVWASGWS